MIEDVSLAAYLEEAGEEPNLGLDTLNSHNIPYVALRHTWTSNVCDISDTSCQKLRALLKEKEVSVIAIMSNLGSVQPQQLRLINDQKIQHVFDIAAYFGAKYVRFNIGVTSRDIDTTAVEEWMNKISTLSIKHSVIPLFELSHNNSISEPAAVASLLYKHKKWKIIYDPAQLILTRNINPYVKYWVLLKQFVEIIDLRDYKIGKGFKPVGFGDTKIVDTVKDAIGSGFSGWFIAEPTLGRKHGSALTRSDTFGLAMEAISNVFS